MFTLTLRVIAVVLVAALLGCGADSSAQVASARDGTVVPASDLSSFMAALAKAKPGETIELADGTYPVLDVVGKRELTIMGSRGAKLDGIRFERSSNIVLRGVTIMPSGDATARVDVEEASTDITLDDVLVDGRDPAVGAFVTADETVKGLTIRDSEVTNCGEGERCIAVADGTKGVVVVGSSFHDCVSCDFIRGGSGMVIRGNTFDRAFNGSCELDGRECAHNDLVQVFGGGPCTITGNEFGDVEGAAAALFVSLGKGQDGNPIHDVRIASNVFEGDAGFFAIKIKGGAPATSGLVRDISVVNNTILAGSAAALEIEEGWEMLPRGARPLVANNVFGRIRNKDLCARARLVANVVGRGVTCQGLRRGRLALDSSNAPTRRSKALVNRASPRYAPSRDHLGRKRVGRPDIGAIEYRRT